MSFWRPGLLALLLACPAAGDVVRLKRGGEVRGSIVSPPLSSLVEVETIHGLVVELDRDDVDAIIVRPIEAEQYVELAREVADKIPARMQLAEWCRQNRLRSERAEQFRAILKLDPEFEEAHKALGHVQHEGRWVTVDVKMKADGFVKIGRRWVTPAEAALMEEIDEQSERAKAWYPRAQELKRRFEQQPATFRQTLDAIASVEDPAALAAWTKTFSGNPNPAVRTAMIVALSRMNVAATIRPLAELAVNDGVREVRQAAVEAMPAAFRDVAVRRLADWLHDENNTLIQRASAAIETLGDDAATVQLANSLQTNHWTVVETVERAPAFSVGTGGRIGFETPTVGVPQDLGNGFIGIPTENVRIVRKRVVVAVRNESVLKALIATTGQNFGYNKQQWINWYRRKNG